MATSVLKGLLYLSSAILIALGILFIIASYTETIRFAEGLVFIGVAFIIAYYARGKRLVEIKRAVTLSGPMRVRKAIRCPHCGARLNPEKIKIIDGRPYLTCDYCKNRLEISEEPDW